MHCYGKELDADQERCSTPMQKEIAEFLRTGKIATICYVADGLPLCFNCFYAVIPGTGNLVYKSSKSTMHGQITNDTPVAGTIYQASDSGFNNTGIQFSGKLVTGNSLHETAGKIYYSRFPAALIIPGQLFVVSLSSIKYTQAWNGIRHKLAWEAQVKND